MTSLQDTVQEYLQAPPANTLPVPQFASSSSVHLEEGMHRMSEVVQGMSDQGLSDQGSQDSKKSAWKTLKLGGTAIPKWTEYWANDEMVFFLSDDPIL